MSSHTGGHKEEVFFYLIGCRKSNYWYDLTRAHNRNIKMMSLALGDSTIYDIKKQIKVLRFISTVMWLAGKQHISQSRMMCVKCCYSGSDIIKWRLSDHYIIMAQAKLFHQSSQSIKVLLICMVKQVQEELWCEFPEGAKKVSTNHEPT